MLNASSIGEFHARQWLRRSLLIALALVLCDGFALAGGITEKRENLAARDASARYLVTPVADTARADGRDAYRADNPAQGLGVVFSGSGVELVSPEEGVPIWTWQLSLSSWGIAGSTAAPSGASLAVAGNRVDLVRREFAEAFVNEPDGVDHRFSVGAAGENESVDDAPLVFEFSLSTPLSPRLSEDRRTAEFLLGGEVALRYEISATDAAGREVPAAMEWIADDRGTIIGFALFLQTGHAEHPVRLEGSLTTPQGRKAERVRSSDDSGEAPSDEGGLALFVPPTNDQCSGAETIPATGPFPYLTTLVSDITSATSAGDPPLPSCQTTVSRSIWYRFTPATTADYTVSACADGPTGTTVEDTVLAIYTTTPDGSCTGAMQELPNVAPTDGCDDDGCVAQAFQSAITTRLTAGTTYFVVAFMFGSTPPALGQTAVQLRVTTSPFAQPPPNDQCDGREVIPDGPYPVVTAITSDITGATTLGDPPGPSCATTVTRSLWYELTPSVTGLYTFSSCTDSPTGTTVDDTVVAVYTSSTDSCAGAMTEVGGACDNDSCATESFQSVVTTPLTAGKKYFVLVWQFGSTPPSPGNTALQLRVLRSSLPPPPPNDQCAGAAIIQGGAFPLLSAVTPDITGATAQGDPQPTPSCDSTIARSVWYAFTPSETAWYTISTCADAPTATTVDSTTIGVYTSAAGCNGPFTETPTSLCTDGCDTMSCTSEANQAVVTTQLVAGQTYYFVVWDGDLSVPAAGNTAVQVRVGKPYPTPPTNDTCAGAEVIPDGAYPVLSSVVTDITGATCEGDAGTPSCQPTWSRGIWYRFTPGSSGYYTVSTCADAGTATTVDDTVLNLYSSGAGCNGPFTELPSSLCQDGCDDDSCASEGSQSVVSSHLDGGATYFILVRKYGSALPAPGNTAVQLKVSRATAVAPPVNDGCVGAEVIPTAGPFPHLSSVTTDVRGAICAGDPPAPSCQPSTSRSIWYRFTPAQSASYTLSVCADSPTMSTVDDTVMAIYSAASGCGGPFTQMGCDSDGCSVETGQSVISNISLAAGTTYYVLVWSQGTVEPAVGNTAIQLRVSAIFPPANDRCSAATPLVLDHPMAGSTVLGANDYQLAPGGGCFVGAGQSGSSAPGRDVVYGFTAPAAGSYSFRATAASASNMVAYVASDCPLGAAPATVSSCLAASNRNSGPAEEVMCVPLGGGQTVYVYVDEATPTNGGAFVIEANRCDQEFNPNDSPGTASATVCGEEGSIAPANDVDFFTLGTPVQNARIFAMVDGAAANDDDFDLRVTTSSATLEYDDSNNDSPFGSLSPNVGGTKTTGADAYLEVNQFNGTTLAEPYRLYSATQPPSSAASAESEPNDTIAQANVRDYVSGVLSGSAPSSDVDVYRVQAFAGDLLFAGLDGDPEYDGTCTNARLEVLNGTGAVILTVNDVAGVSNTRTAVAGNLVSRGPVSCAEALAFRVPVSGTYFVRVGIGTTSTSGSGAGSYLLSISPQCLSADADGDGEPNVSDCARLDSTLRASPGKISGLTVLRTQPTHGIQISWTSLDGGAGTSTNYQVTRGQLSVLRASGYPGAATCVAPALADSPYAELDAACSTPVGNGCWYLVRAKNACGTGSYADSAQGSSHPLDGSGGSCP